MPSNTIAYSNEASDETTIAARFTYDGAGHMLRYVETSKYALRTVERTYDGDLRITQEEDLPGIAPEYRHARWSYDEAKRPVTIAFDLDYETPEHNLDLVTYDDTGRVTRLERRTNGVVQDVTTVTWSDTVVEESHSAGWTWRYTFDGDWMTSLEQIDDKGTQTLEVDTYADVGELASRTLGDWTEHYEWVDHRMVRATYDDGKEPQVVEWRYDDAGRPIERTWHAAPYVFVTTITWNGDRLERVVRRDAASGAIVERWAFTWGCDGSIAMLIAPVNDWSRETTPVPPFLSRTQMWGGFPEVM